MSKLTELLNELCPGGVEYVAAGEIAQIGTGRSDRKDAIEGGEFPFFVRSETVMRHSEYEYDETAIVIPGEGGVGEIFHYVSGKYALHQRAYRVSFTTDAIDTRFAFYHFQANFKRFIERVAVTATVKSIRKPMLTKFPIPVPPLEVQQEIVRVLDAFTDLEQSLVSERELRKKQYEFYRDELLSFTANGGELCSDEVEYRPLGELLAIRDSERRPVTKSDRVPGPYPYYGANGIQDYVNEYIFDGEFILLGEDGSVLTDDFRPVTTWAAGKIWVNNHAHVIAAKSDEINLRFSYYALTSTDIRQFVSGGSRAKLNQSGLRLIPLPVPPLEIQQEIVAKLDTFQALIDSIEQEISLRRQQYEFYRNELLSFASKED